MKNVNEKVLSILDNDYQNWIVELKSRYRKSQIKAAVKVNSELIYFYWTLGRDIVKMKAESRWGTKFYERLSKDLREQFPDATGFSKNNLIYMAQFYKLFPESEIIQQVAGQIYSIPWGHLILLIDKAKGNTQKALFYVQKTIENSWSRATLLNFIDTNLYERSQGPITNFEVALPKEESDLAKEEIKNVYSFNFICVDGKYREKELKDALIENIERFLVELGTGFAYMGREYRLDVGGTELFIDMLFYNTKVHAYVVIEVKVTQFKPEYIGQLQTYVAATNHILKTDRDDKTIGILICKEKNNVLARYALEGSNEPLGITSYDLSNLIPEDYKSSLPTIEEIENELKKKL